MNRRKFIKAGALFVPATFGILVPRTKGQAYLPNRRQAWRKHAAAGGGPDVWYYAGTSKTESSYAVATTTDWAPQSFAYGGQIAVATGGTCTFISAKVGGTGAAEAFKIALYDASNNLLASGSGTTATTPAWADVAISQAVTAVNYRVMVSGSVATVDVMHDTNENGLADAVAYASFPPNPLTPDTEVNLIYGMRMFVD